MCFCRMQYMNKFVCLGSTLTFGEIKQILPSKMQISKGPQKGPLCQCLLQKQRPEAGTPAFNVRESPGGTG